MGTATTYAVEGTVREERERYFLDNGFGAGGNYDDKWVRVMLGPVPIVFPNSPARIRAVRYHDLHHILTGYTTHIIGEFEISAWEVASGCGRLWFAWMINMQGMIAGLLVAPRVTFRAFVRGRHTRNLYDRAYDDALLETRLGELREQLGFGSARERAGATAADLVAFVVWTLIATVADLAFLAALLSPLWIGLWLALS